ncbi:androgen-induced gene 1 protein-like isoform X1 [Littorina saxatilis]|uniref:androgen-induced gene 1 protein-like isoform X1 n=1 Tax=Littorina saxatilis TaxID=31220 RepID=UPI0038B4D222
MKTRDAVSGGFYLSVVGMYIYSLWYNIAFITKGADNLFSYDGYGGKFKYLTFWNHVLQTLYFCICVVNAFAGSDIPASKHPRNRSGLQWFRDILHATLAFPVGMFVVSTFWALYAVDRELVYPRELDALIPPWLNHVMHTTVLPLLLVEKYLVYHHHPRRHNGIFILSAFALLYLAWILWIAFAADLWVYPVLRVMQNHERAIFIMFLLMFFISIYLLGEALTKFLWRKEKAALNAALSAASKKKK